MTPCVSNRAIGCVPLSVFKTLLSSVNGNHQLAPPFSASLSMPNECCPMERFCCSGENVQSRGGDGGDDGGGGDGSGGVHDDNDVNR